MILGVVTTLSQYLNTSSRENSWVSTPTSSSRIPFWTCQHHKMRLSESLKCNNDILLLWWVLVPSTEVVNKKVKELTCEFLHPHGSSDQFQWPQGDYRGYLTRSSWRFRLLIRQQIEEHILSLKRKRTNPGTTLREQVFGWWNFVFCFLLTFDVYGFWRTFHDATHQNFKILLAFVSFLLMIRDSYALLQPIYLTLWSVN